jgi:multidrug resistance protein, MATE family
MTTWTRELNRTLKIAWPVTLGLLGQQILGMVDSMMVGHHSTVELAAAAFVNNLCGPPIVIIIGFTTHVGVLVAQAVGHNGGENSGKILRHSLLWNILISLTLILVLEILNHHLEIFGQPPEVVAVSHTFLHLMSWSLLPFALFNSFRQYSDGLQKTVPPMVITVFGVAINTTLNWFLIYGHGGMPELGIAGAGIATLIARTIMFALLFVLVSRGDVYKKFRGELFGRAIDMKLVRSGLNIGAPSALQYLFESGIFYFAAMMMGWLGTLPLAANQIVMSMIIVLYMFPLSISIATSVRVGEAVGQKDAGAARAIGFGSLYLSTLVTFVCAVLMIGGRTFWPHLFTADEKVIFIASDLFVVAGFFQIFDGAQCVLVGALRGINDVRIPTLMMFISYWGCGATLAYIFGLKLGYGHLGIWAGLAFSVVATALMLIYRFEVVSRRRLTLA